MHTSEHVQCAGVYVCVLCNISLSLSLFQLCVIHHVTMESVLLMILASVLVDTVDPHAANQVYLCTVAMSLSIMYNVCVHKTA